MPAMMKPFKLQRFNIRDVGILLLICLIVMLSQVPRSWGQDLEGALGWKSFGTVGDI
jgi:hypothetical protein